MLYKGPSAGALRQLGQSSFVFPNGVLVVFLEARNLPLDCVQTIMLRIEGGGAVEKRLRTLNVSRSHLCLRCGELQAKVFRRGVGSLRIELGRLILLAVELVGVGQFALSRQVAGFGST